MSMSNILRKVIIKNKRNVPFITQFDKGPKRALVIYPNVKLENNLVIRRQPCYWKAINKNSFPRIHVTWSNLNKEYYGNQDSFSKEYLAHSHGDGIHVNVMKININTHSYHVKPNVKTYLSCKYIFYNYIYITRHVNNNTLQLDKYIYIFIYICMNLGTCT